MRRFAPLVPIVLALSLLFVPQGADAPRSAAADDAKADKPDKVTVFKNATIYTATDDRPIERGYLVVKNGKILAVGGPEEKINLEVKPEEIDLKGAVIIPGLVDTHSHVGVWSRPHV